MQKLEAELSALTSRVALLEGKRQAAQGALDAALEARQSLLLTGILDDNEAARAAQTKVESASSALAGFDNAICSLTNAISEAEGKLEIGRLTGARKLASEKLAAQTDIIEKQIAPWLALTRDLAASTANVGDVHFEVGQIAAYLRNVASEVEMAVTVQSSNLRASVAGIRDGHQAIPRAPEVVVPAKIEPAPPLIQLFSLHAIGWRDDSGAQRVCGKWLDCELPAETAEKALRLGLCVPLSDPRRKRLLGQGGGYHPERNWINDIDDETGPHFSEPTGPVIDPASHTVFTPVDRGPGFQLKHQREG